MFCKKQNLFHCSVYLFLCIMGKDKVLRSPILVYERWALSWSRCTGSQPAGDYESSPGGKLPLLYARLAFYLRKRSPDGATPNWGNIHPIAADYLCIDPEGTKGWVGLVDRPMPDGLPTLEITLQLKVERATGKVRWPETDVLQLSHYYR